jgi:hypothetical protein
MALKAAVEIRSMAQTAHRVPLLLPQVMLAALRWC